MIRYIAALVLALANILGSTEAEAQSTLHGPAYIGVIEAVVDGRRVPLERLSGVMAARSRSMFIGGVEAGWDFDGRSSPIRIRQGQEFFFVARFSNESDPQAIFAMNRMKQTKKARMVPIMRTGSILQSSGTVRNTEFVIPLTFEPYEKDFVKIQPASPLAPGEYIISFGGGAARGFGLGVD